VIVSFGDSATEALYHGWRTGVVRRFPVDVVGRGRRKLDMLDAARRLDDLSKPPGNRLEALRGDRTGFHSIRVNDQWRVVFRWTLHGPAFVSLIDYH
jgi:proteic killer suppression protein